MPAPPQSPRGAYSKLLVLVFLAIGGSFVAASLFIQWTSAEVESASDLIAAKSAPSIIRLSSITTSAIEIEASLSVHLSHGSSRRSKRASSRIDVALNRLNTAVHAYFTLPASDGEIAYRKDLEQAWMAFTKHVKVLRGQLEQDEPRGYPRARQQFERELLPTIDRLLDATSRAIDFNAQQSQMYAGQIQATRRRTILLENILILVCLMVTGGAIWLVYRELEARRTAAQSHAAALEARAAEFEQFAGRVAHDIRNPLNAASLTIHLARQRSSSAELDKLLERVLRSLHRADAITTALLDFARSGARPDPGARCSPRELLAEVVPVFRDQTAAEGIEFAVEPVPAVLVACSSGVYLSITTNLLRNAIKYMGSSTQRRIEVHVAELSDEVRTEVRDTGRGIAPDEMSSLFEAYFRAGSKEREGLGLGLATVKRLVEGHGGRVGVESTLNAGSTFWFTLPHAGSTQERSPDSV